MLRVPFQLNDHEHNSLSLKSRLWKAVKAFWQFSNFYGEYNSLPPSERGKFVNKLNQPKTKL